MLSWSSLVKNIGNPRASFSTSWGLWYWNVSIFCWRSFHCKYPWRLCFCYLQQSIKREKEYLLHQTYAIFDSPGCWLFLSCGEKHLSIAAHQVFWLLWQSFLPWFKQQRRNHGTNNMSYRIAERIRRYVLGLEPLNPPQTLRTPCLCLRTNVASPGKKPVAQPKLIA